MSHSGCLILVPLDVGLHYCVDHYSFASLVRGCAFYSALAYLVYRRSAEGKWFSVGNITCWFPYSLFYSQVYGLVKPVVLSRMPEASGALHEDRAFTSGDVVWSVAAADRCSITDAVPRFHPSQHTDPELLEFPFTSATVLEAYNVDLDAYSNWDLSDIPPSDEINFYSSLRTGITVIRNRYVEHSAEALTTASDVLRLAVRNLRTL